jgi:hypothetical protein
MRAFIIRPFGTKKEIDFDRVERDLIGPALEKLDIEGRTTIDILRQGNIRVDMFQRLLTADLVLADLSIHNANVFYELGIRHALRDKRTFLLRCNSDQYPFDLQTDRYFVYDQNGPAASLDGLVAALRQTLRSEAPDSPVFSLLPDLPVQDRSRFLAVPRDFREEVQRALDARQAGDLGLLSEEVRGIEWESEGLRVVGRAQFVLKSLDGARSTWEALRKIDPMDLEANVLLGTIYQRLGDLTRSDQAIQRVLSLKILSNYDRAEAYSLLGRNSKTRWKSSWSAAPPGRRREEALVSAFLAESFGQYTAGFDADLNHFYSGLNALAMLTIESELAQALPEVWENCFDSPQEGESELNKRKRQIERLSSAVELSIEAAKNRMERREEKDIWVLISEADLDCLTSNRPGRVVNAYRKALADAPAFVADSVRAQLSLYQELGTLKENVEAALSVLPQPTSTLPMEKQEPGKRPLRILLFTGHMIDAPGRKEPRFPPDKEPIAREAIEKAIREELDKAGEIGFGIAGGACGGDILFHEICQEMQIPTRFFLALPPDQFIQASVAHGGPDWIERFHRLCERLTPRILSETTELPNWLGDKPNYTIWQRNNLWTLYNALASDGANVTLFALWDGKKGDGPGGTEDLVEKGKERGVKVIILDSKKLFGFSA